MSGDDLQLPELTEEREREIENSLFTRIDREQRQSAEDSRRRRRRGWSYAGAAAALIVVAGFAGPALQGGVGFGGASNESTAESGSLFEEVPADGSGGGGTGDLGSEGEGATDAGGAASAENGERDVIAQAAVTLEADDAADAAQRIGALAEATGGYVESMSVASDGDAPISNEGSVTSDEMTTRGGGAWITVRVPASDLTDLLTDLDDLGDVRASEITREDVTAETTDLNARISALQTSVDRLEALISDAATTAELLDAENALAARQAELDSLRAQADALEDDVAMSSATVTIDEPQPAVAADPQGFGDGFSTGWNALVAAVNGVVIGLGFFLPWLVVAGIVLLIVRVVRRARPRRRPTVDQIPE
jgi:hypothetical protein